MPEDVLLAVSVDAVARDVSVPRDRSRLPVPVADGHVWVELGTGATRAVPSCSSPPPIAWAFPLIEPAALTRNCLTWSGLASGYF